MILPLQQIGGNVLGQWLAELGVPAASAVGKAITFVVVAVLIYLGGRSTIIPLLDRAFRSRGIEKHARIPLKKLTNLLVLFVAISVAFGFAGYGNFLTSLATIAAAATLAIGFAMQDILKNFVAGVFIYTDRPFRVGDWIEWNDNAGIVEDISLRVTRVTTFDNELLTVPNSELANGVIKNPVAKDRLRLKFVFGIGYDDDIQEATDIIVEEATQRDDILDDPAPSVRLTELGDSSVDLQSRFWIDKPSRSDFVKIKAEYVTAVKERFDEAGIDIPYPMRALEGDIVISNAGEPVAATTESGED